MQWTKNNKEVLTLKNNKMAKQVFKIVEQAKNIHLDPRSRFFKRRLKSLQEVGYEITKKTRNAVTVTLNDD